MKMLAKYLAKALEYERTAAEEHDPELQAEYEKLASAYRALATKRAQQLGLPLPPQK